MDNPATTAKAKAAIGSPEWLDEVFRYHAPTPEQIDDYQKLRTAARAFAEAIGTYCPPCADRTAALRLLHEALFTANSSIAFGGLV